MRDDSSRATSSDGVGTCLRFPAVLADKVRHHARHEYPHECCGVLLGTRGAGLATVVAVRPAANLSCHDRTHHFEVAPGHLLRAIREARGRSLDLVGFYHSHPQGDGIPSRSDLEGAWLGISAVVVPVTEVGCGSFRAYRLVGGGRAVEEKLEEVP